MKKPIVINNDDCVFTDIDETLIFWKTTDPTDVTIEVEDPYMEDKIIKLVPHQSNIDLIKRKYGQGKMIIVWSAGGALWAETVVKALKLETIVTLIMAKPTTYIDDIDVKDWGLNRVYLSKHFRDHPSCKDLLEDNNE